MTGRAALGEEYGYCFQPEPGGQLPLPATGASKWAMLRTAKRLLPEVPRFSICNHAPKKRALGVSVKRKGGTAFFGGLYNCASVWICPVCAPRVSEVRRDELQQAVDNAIAMGYGVQLVTLTFPHGVRDKLETILEKFTLAQKKLKSGRAAAALRARINYIGEVRTLEVTYGVNGWHPHAHSLYITKAPMSKEALAALKDELYAAWRKACIDAGLPEPSFDHGVDIRGARYDIAQYVAKWGFSGELAYTSRKKGKQGGRTPWQLLSDAAEGDSESAALWREFALAYFGKRQLFWSRRKTGRKVKRPVYIRKVPTPPLGGAVSPERPVKVKVGEKIVDEWISLREELSLPPELTDQQLLALDEERTEDVVLLDLDTWHVIRKSHAQHIVLELASSDPPGLLAYLNHLRSTVPMEDGRPPGPREDWEL